MSLTRTTGPLVVIIAAAMLGTCLLAGCGSVEDAAAPMDEGAMSAESVENPDTAAVPPDDAAEQATEQPAVDPALPDTVGGTMPEPAPAEATPGPTLLPATGEPKAATRPQATRMVAPSMSTAPPKLARIPRPASILPQPTMPRETMSRSETPTALSPLIAESAARPSTEPVPVEPVPIKTPDPMPSGEVVFSMAPMDAPIEPPAEQAKAAETEPEKDYTVVKVYYGTDRAVAGTPAPGGMAGPYPTAIAAAITALLLVICYRSRKRWAVGLAIVGLVATVALGGSAAYFARNPHPDKDQSQRAYGNQRGELELGTCEVSIPKRHELGELESPSIIRLEFREDPERHVVLLGVQQRPADEFFKDLGACVADSADKEAFVFIHGYNVTFEKAARRTAQLAHDLKFKGAPIFYSWPSQGGLLQYAVDETNVVWTVPHLKQFLVDVADRSGAKSVHLIAHSMGNRALTSALRGLSRELGDRGPMFREVILTAPDIDAEVFRRDIAPAIISTARRVTLYASSNDEALAASKQVHGYPRAGESGENVVVVPGIDTIDVSAVDTSLLGHSYYGSNDTVLSDLVELLNEARPPDQRTWLQSMPLGPLRYWVFLKDRLGLDPSPPPR